MQQTSTFRCQKLDPFYSKFRGKLNEFIPSLQRQQEAAQKKHVKKSMHQVFDKCFLQFFIKMFLPTIDVFSILGSLECLMTNLLCAFHSLQFPLGGSSFQLTSKYGKYNEFTKWQYKKYVL